MQQFQVGDKVRVTRLAGFDDRYGIEVGDVLMYAGRKEYLHRVILPSGEVRGMLNDQLAPIGHPDKKASPSRFILQYDRDTDPFEFFADEKSLTARVRELTKDHSVKQDSYRWYEIARQGTVELVPRLILPDTVKLAEDKPRRGRPRKVAPVEGKRRPGRPRKQA